MDLPQNPRTRKLWGPVYTRLTCRITTSQPVHPITFGTSRLLDRPSSLTDPL